MCDARISPPFTPEHISLVEAFANQAIIAVQNTNLFNKQKEALDRQTAMAEVLRIVSESPTTLEAVFQGIADRVVAPCDSDDAVAFLQRDGIAYRVGSAGAALSEPRFPETGATLGPDSVPGRALTSGETVHAFGAPEAFDADFPRTAEVARGSGIGGFLAVPLTYPPKN